MRKKSYFQGVSPQQAAQAGFCTVQTSLASISCQNRLRPGFFSPNYAGELCVISLRKKRTNTKD
jgi:hypothetical protein